MRELDVRRVAPLRAITAADHASIDSHDAAVTGALAAVRRPRGA